MKSSSRTGISIKHTMTYIVWIKRFSYIGTAHCFTDRWQYHNDPDGADILYSRRCILVMEKTNHPTFTHVRDNNMENTQTGCCLQCGVDNI